MAQAAMKQGKSKSDWLNEMYGTDFFRGSTDARKSWGKDWAGGGRGTGGGMRG